MAKKRFNVSSTLNKNKDNQDTPELAKPIPLKKNIKNVDAVKEKVEELHNDPTTKTTIPKPTSRKTPKTKSATKSKIEDTPQKLVRLTIDTPEDMHKQLKVRAVLSNISMRDFILKLIEKELKKDF